MYVTKLNQNNRPIMTDGLFAYVKALTMVSGLLVVWAGLCAI